MNNTVLMLDLAHMALLALRQANEEGRDVTAEEIAALRGKLDADLERVQKKVDAMD